MFKKQGPNYLIIGIRRRKSKFVALAKLQWDEATYK